MSELKYPVLLDGGLSNRLEQLGCNLNHFLWTAEALRSAPDAIVQTHLDYLNAGAQIITTASYQATFQGFKKMGIEEKEAAELMLKSVELARTAIEQFLDLNPGLAKPLVAASIGPYGAYLADGSEYKGNYPITEEELHEFHLPKIQLLDEAGADLLACETVPSYPEAKVLKEILMTVQTHAWITFSCKDEGHISDGTTIEKSLQLFSAHPTIWAMGVNCTRPMFISGLIRRIREHQPAKKIIVYPNSGEIYHAEDKSWSPTEDAITAELISEWLDLGVDILGGCCRVGPEQIRSMNKILFSIKRA